MKVTVVGTGYVGLVSGACLAEVGNTVTCVDTDELKVASLKKGEIPIFEPGLDLLVVENARAHRLFFTTDIAEGIRGADVVLIAVGTPPDEDGSADLKHVLTVATSIGEHLDSYTVVVNKSTVPVGTAEKVREAIDSALEKRGTTVDYSVVSNPEFLKEGAAIDDFMKPDRVIVGVDNERAAEIMRTLYAPFNRNHDRLIVMDVRSAELTKYAANAMLATKISFMNEMANLAEKVGADIEAVRVGIGSDPRIGYQFIYPGCGYGGSCFPKDVKALYRTSLSHGYEAAILSAVEEVNDRQKRVLVDKIAAHFGTNLEGKTFALWGLAFKPNTDDMREAPSRVIMEGLWSMGGQIAAFDPVAMDEARRIYGPRSDLKLCEDPMDAVADADALLVVTEWKQFRSPDFSKLRDRMRGHVIFDGRNIFSPAVVESHGFEYHGIGR